ncbi:hypothetical protein [Streptomyces sp. NPDC050560]|uniref:hypothetical protein n=1 Tax=Streptomyces sp. NPDC050560 TaxID=3365630 RepID=UPI003791D64A
MTIPPPEEEFADLQAAGALVRSPAPPVRLGTVRESAWGSHRIAPDSVGHANEPVDTAS